MNNFVADFTQRPIVILGMHRSGTSLLTELLIKSGVFFGIRRDSNQEAIFFQDINRWIFKNFSTKWDQIFDPESIPDSIYEELALIIKRYLTSFSPYTFTGLKTRIYRNPIEWGWKDPRTLYNLKLWEKVYPESIKIGIKRHGFDVAESLRRRNQRLRKSRLKALYNNNKVKYLTKNINNIPALIDSPLIRSFDYGMKLWDNYNTILDNNIKKENIIYYEDIIDEPIDTLNYINKKFNLNLTISNDYKNHVNRTNKSKYLEWKNKEELKTKYKKLLNKHGYY